MLAVRQRQIRRQMQRQQNPRAIIVGSRTLESRKLIECQRDVEMPDSVSQDDFSGRLCRAEAFR